ncbi:hypothetical protein [Geoalkalibacter halelectricus]|uniref:Uncharacterized protein n=1 Tax=Geoalkalibacter halelectricus TaxID=2847045 RepID=A0ABY5ZNH8_9BACT|nr:hypothetical protein [Geoalkalibacter halelectricus]MDO3377540.1 hypothetical protein [Geoalkalibacter halelectricus]UWZ80702.1 hypothetical protein L9S41_04695 [Geoalkalibacter halelectricus]
MAKRLTILTAAILACVFFAGVGPALGSAPSGEEFGISHEPRQRGNILDLFFGPAPRLPTERGKLVIYAFHDANGNNRRDPGERELHDKIRCTVDEITYQVPALIPGLDLSAGYDIECEGDDYLPLLIESHVFIERRGQIIRIDLPCQKLN